MNYLRMCCYYLFKYDVEKDGGLYKLTGWQHIRATDGPVHSVSVWWAGVRYNWFTLGLVCSRKGHAWRTEHIGRGTNYQGQQVTYRITSCSRCGNYRGRSMEPIT